MRKNKKSGGKIEKKEETSSSIKDTDEESKVSLLSEDNKEEESFVDNFKKEKYIEEKKVSKILARKKQNKQIGWAVVLMISLILIVVLVPYIKMNYIDKFVYMNLDFQKTKLGDMEFYSTQIPVTDKNNNIIGTYSMNFRTDPRKLDDIKIEMPNNNVIFKKDEPNYISLDMEDVGLTNCSGDSGVALINLAGFLNGFGNLTIASAVTDKDYAYNEGKIFRDCLNTYDNTVLVVHSGDENIIRRENMNCYKLTFKDCDIIPVTEKLMLIILENYMSYFVRE